MTPDDVRHWLDNNPLNATQVDCVIAVMLKILDGKCKMELREKAVMTLLYDAVKNLPAEQLSDGLHTLIAQARRRPTNHLRELVYENRVLAETRISRPVMKTFKAMIHRRGLFECDLGVVDAAQ